MVSESDDNSALAWMKDNIDYFIDSYEKATAEAIQGGAESQSVQMRK